MALFRSRPQQDIDTVRQKLEGARRVLAEAVQARADAALAAALSPDPWAAESYHESVRRARERVELLEAALEQAEELERQRKADVHRQHTATRNRALRQHIAALAKASRDFEKYTAWQVDAFDRMLSAGAAARALLPPGNEHYGFAAALSYGSIREQCQTELNRVGADNAANVNGRPAAPGTNAGPSFYPLKAPKLAEELEGRLMRLYNSFIGKPAPVDTVEPPPVDAVVPTEPVAEVKPEPSAQPSGPRPQDISPLHGPVAPLPYDMSHNPWPAGSEEAREFEEERARLITPAPTDEAAEPVETV